MSESLGKSSKFLRIFGSYKFFLFLITLVISLNLFIPNVSAAEWEEVQVTDPRILFCYSAFSDGTLVELKVGTSGPQIVYYPDMAWFCLTQKIPIYSDCTYEITFVIDEIWKYFWSSPIEHSFNITSDVPGTIGDLVEQRNTAGDRYIDTVHFTDENVNGVNTTTFSFSTSEGFIDNIDFGSYYVTFSELVMPYDGEDWYDWTEEHYWTDISSISVKCIMDPGAGYFTDKVIESLNTKAAELDAVGSALSEQESWLLDKSKSLRESVADDFANMLNEANSLVTPTRRNSNTLLGGVEAVGTIFKSFTNSLPPVFASLITTIAILYFIAWLIGRRE